MLQYTVRRPSSRTESRGSSGFDKPVSSELECESALTQNSRSLASKGLEERAR